MPCEPKPCVPAPQVQHAGLQESCAADTLTVDFLVRAVHWAFPDFNYLWLVDEIRENAPKARPLARLVCQLPVASELGLALVPY